MSLARYYSGDVPPLPATLMDELAHEVNAGETPYSEALQDLIRAEIHLVPGGVGLDIDTIKVTRAFKDAITGFR